MSLRFHYQLAVTPHPILPLGGRFVRPRPIIPVTIIGPGGTNLQHAILDPASDDTVFPERVATSVGIDLANAPQGRAVGVGLVIADLRYAEVSLGITNGKEKCEWKAWFGFTTTKLKYPILGFAGFLQCFDACFFGGREEVELVVNGLFPKS